MVARSGKRRGTRGDVSQHVRRSQNRFGAVPAAVRRQIHFDDDRRVDQNCSCAREQLIAGRAIVDAAIARLVVMMRTVAVVVCVAVTMMVMMTTVVVVDVVTDVREGQVNRFHGSEAEQTVRHQQKPDTTSG